MQAVAEHIDYKALYEQAELKIAALAFELEKLKKMIFGSKQERFVNAAAQDDPQLTLDLDLETIAACKIMEASKVSYIRTKTEVTENKPKVHPGRMKLPDHLRREVILVQPESDVTGLKKIGDEVSEVLDYVPAELFVKQYIRPKYVQPLSEVSSTVITPSLPARIMEKCMAGEGLVAQIVVDKYVDHIPLHRQMQRFARVGVNIAQSTITTG
jgi:transposase